MKQALSNSRSQVIKPYGGKLENLMLSAVSAEKIQRITTQRLECSDRNACDIELLLIGGFSPLKGFMNKADYQSVVKSNRTISGKLFGLPIVMDTDREDIRVGDQVLLTYKGQDIAILKIEEKSF